MTERTGTGGKRPGPGRPSNADRAADLAGQLEQTLNGLADLIEPPDGVDVETVAGVIRRDARTIAEYAAGLAEKHTAAMGGVKRLLVASGAIRAFGPLVGMLLGRAFARREEEPPDPSGDVEPPPAPEGIAPGQPHVHRARVAGEPG